MKLLAGRPGWTVTADVIVIGSGVAGLTTALNLRSYGLSVLLVIFLVFQREILNSTLVKERVTETDFRRLTCHYWIISALQKRIRQKRN